MPKLLIIDDDPFTRVFIRQVMKKHPDIEVVGEAGDGQSGIDMALRLQPDVVSMDILMPGMDGLVATTRLLAQKPMAIIMVSELTQEDSASAIKALELGAVDFVSKSSTHLQFDIPHVTRELPEKVRYWASNFRGVGQSSRQKAKAPSSVMRAVAPGRAVEMILVGVSTGGPQVLPDILKSLGNQACPVVVAQHMPAIFTQPYVARLREVTGLNIQDGKTGMALEKGGVYVIPGGSDGVVHSRGGVRTLSIERLANTMSHPCIDTLFQSAVNSLGSAVGVILSGSGENGAAGACAMVQKGWPVLVQKPESCVADEMPMATIHAGGATELLNPQDIASRLRKWI